MAIKSFGRLDAMIINHGVLEPMERIERADIDAWKAAYDANFFSALALVRTFLGLHVT
jgi:NAD(P)-dependent dehydrogenase (short-subunit alcohol dehydrogenase family)